MRPGQLRLAGLALLIVLTVALGVFVFQQTASGCSRDTISDFAYWRRGLLPLWVLLVIGVGFPSYAAPRLKGLRIFYISVLIIAALYFISITMAVYLPAMLYRNSSPALKGTFINPANDDRYCCVFSDEALAGDCPPKGRECLDISELCSVSVSQNDLIVDPQFMWEFVWTEVYVVVFAVLAVLAVGMHLAQESAEKRAILRRREEANDSDLGGLQMESRYRSKGRHKRRRRHGNWW